MWKVFNFEQHMALDRNFINKQGAMLLSFFKKIYKINPKYFAGKSQVPFVQPYLKSQLLDSMGSLSCFSSQEQGESQGIKSMQVYHEVYGVQKHIFFIYQFLNSHVSREVYECGSANQRVCRSKRCRVLPRFGRPQGLTDPLVDPSNLALLVVLGAGPCLSSGGCSPPQHLFSCTCFI